MTNPRDSEPFRLDPVGIKGVMLGHQGDLLGLSVDIGDSDNVPPNVDVWINMKNGKLVIEKDGKPIRRSSSKYDARPG